MHLFQTEFVPSSSSKLSGNPYACKVECPYICKVVYAPLRGQGRVQAHFVACSIFLTEFFGSPNFQEYSFLWSEDFREPLEGRTVGNLRPATTGSQFCLDLLNLPDMELCHDCLVRSRPIQSFRLPLQSSQKRRTLQSALGFTSGQACDSSRSTPLLQPSKSRAHCSTHGTLTPLEGLRQSATAGLAICAACWLAVAQPALADLQVCLSSAWNHR